MSNLAFVLVAAASADFAAGLLERLQRNGYAGHHVASASAALAQARDRHPDVVVIGPALADAAPITLAQGLKADEVCRHVPVVMVTEGPSPDMTLQALSAGVDDVLSDASDLVALTHRIRPLLRVSTMHAELRHRAAVARRFGIDAAPAVTVIPRRQPELLLVGSDLADLHQIIGNDAAISASGDLFEAEDLLSTRDFDAAIVVSEAEDDRSLAFCTQIRNNPRLFNLPVLLVDGGEHPVSVVEAHRRGASRVLRRPLEAVQFRCALATLVQRQRLRWSIRQALHNTLSGPTRDGGTGAYTKDFLVPYLRGRIDAAVAEGRQLSVLFFKCPGIADIAQEFGDASADHLRMQIGQWIGGLLRGEDLTARYGEDEFGVVLPDTPLDEAEVVMNRIAGVVARTDFAVRDIYRPVKVWVQTGLAAVTAADGLDTLISRARARMD